MVVVASACLTPTEDRGSKPRLQVQMLLQTLDFFFAAGTKWRQGRASGSRAMQAGGCGKCTWTLPWGKGRPNVSVIVSVEKDGQAQRRSVVSVGTAVTSPRTGSQTVSS